MSLSRISESELANLRAAHPGIPADYLSFLSTHGWGELASGVQLYSGPIAPEECFGPRACSVPDVLLIADDFAGTSFAFVPSQHWSIVSIDSLDMRTHPESASFTEFLSDYHDNTRNS